MVEGEWGWMWVAPFLSACFNGKLVAPKFFRGIFLCLPRSFVSLVKVCW